MNPAIIFDRKEYDPRKAGCRCDVCPLKGKIVVPPEGPPDAEAMVIAEGPGDWEERKKRPLVGPSGLLLDELLYRSNIKRNRLWISNTTLCRPEVPGLTGKERYSLNRYMAWIRAENAKRRKEAKAAHAPPQLLNSPIECCKGRLDAEVQWFDWVAKNRGEPNGVMIYPTGGYALKTLTRKEGIMKHMGSPTPVQIIHEPLHEGEVVIRRRVDEDIPF